MIEKEEYLKAKQIVQEYEKQLNISDVICSLSTTKVKVPKEFCHCKNPLDHNRQCPVGNDI